MRFRQWVKRWLMKALRRRPVRSRSRRQYRPAAEALESRDLLAVSFLDPTTLFSQPFTVPAGKDLLIPLTASTDLVGNAVNFTVTSSNSAVTASIVTGGRSLDLEVAGDGFSGHLIFRLFEDLAPVTTSRIIFLVQSGFYTTPAPLTFHRIIDNFMAQGGDPNGDGTGGTGTKFRDEFHASLTFTSPGLLAMANSGDDTNDSQFFITDIDVPLGSMAQHLNFNHTIFGQLVSGFSTFQALLATPVVAQNSPFNNEVSRPVVPPTIQSATVFVDNQNGVLRISPPAGFVGSTTITVTADDTSGPVSRSFTVNVVADGINDRPFLGHIPDVTTSRGTAVTIDLPATDLENDPLTFVVRDPNNFANNPPNVTVSINQTARRATITPNPGFVGTVEMLVGVRDQIPRDGNPDLNARSQFDTQRVTLTVTGAVDLDADSDTGLFNDDNYTNDSTPSFTIYAPPGQTVQVQVNGGPALGTSETSPGIYRVTLPAGQVQVGHNVITATANGEPVGGPMTFTYAPSQLSFYVVPGAPGTPQTVTFEHVSSESAFRNELGAFVVDDFEGRVNGLLPNAPGYAQAALSSPSRQVLVARNAPVGATASMNLQGGQILGFYLIQNGTTAQFLAGNPTNSLAGNGPVAFFSFIGANPDGVRHAQAVGDPTQGRVIYGWEDLTGGGDSDYNDNVILVRTAGTAAAADEALRVPAGPGRDVTLSFQLQTALTSQLNSNPTLQRPTAAGEFGFFRVDDATGRIGDLSPGDAGYAQAALLARTAIFAFGTPALSTQTVTLPGGTLIGFYLIPGSSAADFLATNPSNAVNGSPVAFFSFDAANPDNGREHFRSYSPERISRPLPDVDSPIRIHALDQLFGTSADYDDLLVTLLIAP